MTRRFVSFGRALSVDTVADWCDLARRAPSAGFSQGVHFLVRSDVTDTLDALGSLEWWTARHPGVVDASAVVVVLADPSAYTDRYGRPDKAGRGLEEEPGWRVPYWIADAGMVVQNLLLIAESDSRGALFAGVFRDPSAALISWGVPSGVECIGLVFVGERHPDDRPSGSGVSRRRRRTIDVVHRDTWGSVPPSFPPGRDEP
ncbi:MAG: nitroreductase family protein [Actinomycetota bacterium]|nr:nitroreductase family protein [Actinomycetota bacterium]MDA2970852.1 nitroreductase family protein [Actinomycetota bacterium]MDA3000162.1 nitroreductase family protein [Actinomycetota bacterium]